MKFSVGSLGIELLFSWNPGNSTVSIGPSTPTKPGVTTPTTPTKPPTTPAPVLRTNIRQVVYKITSTFEGGPVGKINFTNLTGDGDGQGYSIGFLQWCVGQGSDIPLFERLEALHPGLLESIFGKALYNEFMTYFRKPLEHRLAWVKKAVNNTSGKIEPNWKRAFIALCETHEFQEVQLFFAEAIFQRAVALCREYGVKTNRALALMFDIVTQNGSIKSTTKAGILEARKAKERVLGRALREREYLEIIAIKRSEASNPQWVNDVKSRKLCIVNGTGTVHGMKFTLSQFGLDDDPFVL